MQHAADCPATIVYEDLSFIPVVGLAGSGKSALIARLRDDGKQALSIEDAAGVTGVCLAPLFGERVVGQRELDHRLQHILFAFDPACCIYIEWKKHQVTGYELPDALVAAIRRCPAVYVDASLEQRIDNLLTTYSAWEGRFDTFFHRAKHAGLGAELMDALHRAASISTRRFVETLLADHLDPLYVEEIGRFDVFWRYERGQWMPRRPDL